MSTLNEVVQFLMDNGYAVVVKGKYMFTAKFNKEITGVEQGVVLLANNVPAVIEPKVPKILEWRGLYLRFIQECAIPSRINGPNGTPYQTNVFSEGGMKAFRQALEKHKVDYPTLVESTKLYYASDIPYKVSIGRFMEENQWITHYDEYLKAQQAGKITELEKTKQDGRTTKWRL